MDTDQDGEHGIDHSADHGAGTPQPAANACRPSPHAVFSECPHCAGPMRPEHAHFRCGQCGWRDSCCD